MDGLRFVAADSFGAVQPLAGSPLAFAIAVVRERAVVLGLASDDAVAVRVTDAMGEPTVQAVEGRELDRGSAFVVVLPPRVEPVVVESLGRDGATMCREPVVPQPTGARDIAERIRVRAVTRDHGRASGTIVLEGSVDDAAWEYGIAVSPDGTLHVDFQLSHDGGGGGSSAAGLAPQPGPGKRLRVDGVGTTGDTWHLTGWADPAITEVVLHLRSGERLRLPTAGRELALGYVVLAVALPGAAAVVVAEGYDENGRRVAWEDLRGSVAWVEGSMAKHRERHARASAPVPGSMRALWHTALGTALEEARPPHRRAGARTRIVRRANRTDVATRWPIRPLLVPFDRDAPAGRWVLEGKHDRWEIGQVVGVGTVWFGGPDLDEDPDPDDRIALLARGVIILRQFVTWSDPQAVRDPPNTFVRGRPAALSELTAEANNADLLTFHWQEPVVEGLTEPLSGLWLSAEAHPRRHSVEDIRRFIEDLRSAE